MAQMTEAQQKRFEWQEQFLPEVKKIVGPLLLMEAPLEIDQTQATDLMVLTGKDMRIGCRMRGAGYADQYPWDFTVRSRYDTGTETELHKIMQGWGDWMFYGHAAAEDSTDIVRWLLIDLEAFRVHFPSLKDGRAYIEKHNTDGSHFIICNARMFPKEPPILVASSHKPEGMLFPTW